MSTRQLLIVVILLQSLLLLGQWTGGVQLTTPAVAQVPNAGDQRLQQLDELQAIRKHLEILNAKVGTMHDLLAGGKVQVQAASPDQR